MEKKIAQIPPTNSVWFSSSRTMSLYLHRLPNWREALLEMSRPLQKALDELDELERGAIANPDENRMVGHYWLRAPDLAPTEEISREITETIEKVEKFANAVLTGKLAPAPGKKFESILHVGIGGSSLGPQLLYQLYRKRGFPPFTFIDNVDPEGILEKISQLELERTLIIIASKSGKTKETLTALEILLQSAGQRGLDLRKNLVALTSPGSPLSERAGAEGWLAQFPIWEWVGGRTSIFSPVGLLPLGLMGESVREFLDGAAQIDREGRNRNLTENPAAIMASIWYRAVQLCGKSSMAVLPYRDRLELFPRYLQQLIMESLGKKFDRKGRVVHTGLTVYGNKGTTDQHALIQQLQEGPDDFFAVFIASFGERRADESSLSKAADRARSELFSFLLGISSALSSAGRWSLILGLPDLSPKYLGGLIALFERSVGLYASLLDINAYNQPGVEAGKRLLKKYLEVREKIQNYLQKSSTISLEELATSLDEEIEEEEILFLLEELAAERGEKLELELERRGSPSGGEGEESEGFDSFGGE